MGKDFFALYDAIIKIVNSDEHVVSASLGARWGIAHTETHTGIAMNTVGNSIAPMFPDGIPGLSLREAAEGIKSWNMAEATLALAAVNAYFNTAERVDALGVNTSAHYTDCIDFAGKTACFIGHMRSAELIRERAKKVYIIEREPGKGDYPDSACDFILPSCDIAIITGSSLINKTLPHLLELCENAYTVLAGPSVPLCGELLDYGIDMLSGLAVTDREKMSEHTAEGRRGSPMYCGVSFTLSR